MQEHYIHQVVIVQIVPVSPHTGGRGGVAPLVVGKPGPETAGGMGDDPGGGGGGIPGGIIPEEATAALTHRHAKAA